MQSRKFLLLVTGAILTAIPGTAALQIQLQSTGQAPTLCTSVGNFLSCSGSDANFTVQLSTAITTTPGPFVDLGKTLNVVATQQAITSGAVLTLSVYAYNFTTPPVATGPYTLTESVTANNPIATSFGSITGQGYIANPLPPGPAFNTTGQTSGPATVSCLSIGAPGCGAGGAFLGTGTSSGNVNITGDFALTNIMTFDPSMFSGAGIYNFTSDLALTAVPEPASITLFGAVLFSVGFGLRRRRVANGKTE